MKKERIATVSAFSTESPVGSRGEVAESCARSDKPRLLAASKAPRNDKVITVIEYVHTADGGLARVDQLGPEQYEQFRRWLGCTYLNELFRGQAEFCYPEATDSKQGVGGR